MKKSSLSLGMAASLLLAPLTMGISHAATASTFWGVSATATLSYNGYEATYATGASDAQTCGDVSGQAWTYGSPYVDAALTVVYAQPIDLDSVLINFSNDLEDTLKVEVANGPSGQFTEISTITTDYYCSDANSAFNIPVSIPVNGEVVADRVRITVLTEDSYPEIDSIGFVGTPHVDVAAPVKTKNPIITGTAKVTKVLSANAYNSSWQGSPTFAYAWFACTAKGTTATSVKPADCKAIAGATKSNLTLKVAQKGKFIRVRVIATNAGGSVVAFSKSTTTKVA